MSDQEAKTFKHSRIRPWVKWSGIVGAIVVTLVLLEKAQPYVEGYATKQTNEKLMMLAKNQDSMKAGFKNEIRELEGRLEKKADENNRELVKMLILALNKNRGDTP